MTNPSSQALRADGQPYSSGLTELIRLLNLILRQARLVFGSALLVGLMILLYLLTRPRTYTATASFLLQSPKTAGVSVPALAAQLGLSLPSSDPGQSPAFYSEMIKSRGILSALVDSTYTYRSGDGRTVASTLADAFRVPQRSPPLRREGALQRLDRAITVRTSLKSGVVTFSVEAPAAELAPEIARAVLSELSFFNLQRRQSQAAAERKFTERRLVEVGEDLRTAENALADFLRRNRSTANSPQLRFQEDRLTREVELRRALYTTMAQSYEQAKIEEVRDTPQMTVVQQPEIPARPDPRFLVGKTLLGVIFGGLIGLLLGYFKDRWTAAERLAGDELAEFARLRGVAVAAIRRRPKPARADAEGAK